MDSVIGLFRENFRVRYGDVDASGSTSVRTICSLFQEVAHAHGVQLSPKAEAVGAGGGADLCAMKLLMHRFPCFGECFSIASWRSPGGAAARPGVRNFILYDSRNNEIGWGMGCGEIPAPGRPEAPQGPEPSAGEASGDGPLESGGFSRLAFPKRTDASREFCVRRSDMDIYQHVGSTRYIDWALETLPDAMTDGWQCRSLEFHVRAGLAGGQRVSAIAEIRERHGRIDTVHSLHARDDFKVAALVSTTWRPAAGARAQAGGEGKTPGSGTDASAPVFNTQTSGGGVAAIR